MISVLTVSPSHGNHLIWFAGGGVLGEGLDLERTSGPLREAPCERQAIVPGGWIPPPTVLSQV